MGHQIVYCGRCGSGIRHDEFDRGRAVMIEMIAYCRGCVPADTPRELPAATPRRGMPAVRSDSSVKMSVGTGRRTRPGVGAGPWVAGAAGALVLLAGLAYFSSGTPSQPSDGAPPPASRPARPLSASPVEALGPPPVLAELLALEKAGGDPDALLLRCDAAKPLLKGTPAEKTLAEIEQRAATEKARRDRERQFETALRNAMELIDSPKAAEREKEVLALLAAAAEIAGPRKAEVVALEARYREVLARAAEAPAPPAAAPAPPPAPPPGTLLFQDGVYPTADYRGTADATLAEASPDKAKGRSPALDIDGDNPGRSGKDTVALLRWDLTSVSPGTRIASAEMVLRVQDSTKSTYLVYALVRPWSEAEATWNRASSGQAWEGPGARGAADRRPAPVGRLVKASGTVRIALEGALVQEWIDHPSTNHGVMLAGPDATDGLLLRSREWSVASERPMLHLLCAERPARVVFHAGKDRGFAKMEGGTPTPEGLRIPPGGAFTSWRAFATPVGPGTRMRFRMKPSADMDTAYVITWCDARKKNAWYIMRNLRKDTWIDVDAPVADFRFGFSPQDPRFEGEVFDGFKIYFDDPKDAHLLLERVEVVEAGT
ncbi:MAG TPA: DNRLRE domain-containing protein [Planctomycetota bacterium]|nr:DNRLRE domain-containing protein [Planctomycetota bacterium]